MVRPEEGEGRVYIIACSDLGDGLPQIEETIKGVLKMDVAVWQNKAMSPE